MKTFASDPQTLIITQNGEAKTVVMDIHAHEHQHESVALPKLLSMSNHDFAAGHFDDADAFFGTMKIPE